MNSDRAADFAAIAGALVLVGSAVVVRTRSMPRGRTAGMALAWAAIFALLFAVAHLLDGRG